MNTQNTAVVEEEEEFAGRTGRKGKTLDKYAARRIRHGKTHKDRESGAWKNRLENLAMRAAWINETRSKVYGAGAVPAMHKPHGNGNSSKRFKLKPAKAFKG